MKRVLLQDAYVLHRRPFRETSFLIDLFTADYGRMTVLARGVRKTRSQNAGLLQPFMPLFISWMGRTELVKLTDVEAAGTATFLQGEALFAGFYLNELIMALLQKWDAQPRIFQLYQQTITALAELPFNQIVLRRFEKRLLQELGYGLLPLDNKEIEQRFVAEHYYRFVPEHGFMFSELGHVAQSNTAIFKGTSLQAIAKEEFTDAAILADAKRLMRFVLTPLLGAKQINSRRLFLLPEERTNDK